MDVMDAIPQPFHRILQEEVMPVMATKADKGYIVASYILVFFAQFFFAAAAMYMAYRQQQRQKSMKTEDFLTSRKSVGPYRIGWSFYSGVVGAWIISSVPSYGTYAGLLGIIIYSLTAGLPILMIAYLGQILSERFPHIVSSSDYARKRFGPAAQFLLMCLTVFNMSIGLMVEYITMGIIFKHFLGTPSYGIIIYYGILTLIYTAYGGLYISIITDTFQGIASVVCAVIVFWYVVAKFRFPLAKPMPIDMGLGFKALYDEKARYGLSSICAMTLSLFCATVFSEAYWQRCWASESKKTLYMGATMGCIGIIIVTFAAGLAGWLSAWAGYYHPNYNLQFFMIFPKQANAVYTTTTYCNVWISVVVIICAAIMSEGLVDSIQNGLTCTIMAYFFPRKNVRYARGCVVVVNAILIGIACKDDASVLPLFLVANMLMCCCAIPIFSGVFDKDGKYVTGDMATFSCLFAIFFTSVFGVRLRWNDYPAWSGPHKFRYGMRFTWYANGYDWKYFLVACGTSTCSLVLTWAIGKLVRMAGYKGPGLNEFFEREGEAIFNRVTSSLMRTPLRPIVHALITPDEEFARDAKSDSPLPPSGSESDNDLKAGNDNMKPVAYPPQVAPLPPPAAPAAQAEPVSAYQS